MNTEETPTKVPLSFANCQFKLNQAIEIENRQVSLKNDELRKEDLIENTRRIVSPISSVVESAESEK